MADLDCISPGSLLVQAVFAARDRAGGVYASRCMCAMH